MAAKLRSERMKKINRQLDFEDMAESKIYNGRRYIKGNEKYSTKAQAIKSAKGIREIGFNSRVVKGPSNGLWAVYVNPKITERSKKLQRSKTKRAKAKSAKEFKVHQTYVSKRAAQTTARNGKERGRWTNYRIVETRNKGKKAYRVEVKNKRPARKGRYA